MDRNELVTEAARAMLMEPGDSRAAAVLDAILPQVTTVEELEALPVGTKLLDCDGEGLTKISNRLTFGTAGGELVSAEELIGLHDDGTPLYAPLTVVWRP